MFRLLLHSAVAVTWSLGSGLAVAAERPPAGDPVDGVVLVDVAPELAELAQWSVGLFEEAGLDLPPITFIHHGDDTAPCSGWTGVHRHVDGHSTVDICTSEVGGTTPWLVLHETAHAWAAHDLDEGRRADFQALRGWTHWSNHDETPWHENGTEQAAEIISWGLIDRPAGVATIHDHSCDELDAGYRTLTGQPPLHGFRDHC